MKECPSCKRIWEDKVSFCPLDGQPLSEKSEADLFIGRLLDDKYRLNEKVGEGGFGCVYKATHIEIDNTVAVKILHPHLAADQISIERFRREARAAAQIRHPNAVAVTDFGVTKEAGTAYLVMEFLEGIDLRRKLKQQRQLDYQQAILLIIQACEAVHAAHLKGIIHRDLKPDNIWITTSGDGSEQVKVLDFGIAKLKAGAVNAAMSATELTQQGVIVGTPHYMSPEQGRGEELDARSDIYSLGIILYETVTGKIPFNGKTALDVVLKHNSNLPTPPSQLRPGIPARLEKIILRALEKKPELRQASALELADELEAVLYDFGVPFNFSGNARKRNAQWSGNSFPPERPMSLAVEDERGADDEEAQAASATKVFESGREKKEAAEKEVAIAQQTLPMHQKRAADERATPAAGGKTDAPAVATDGKLVVTTPSPERPLSLVSTDSQGAAKNRRLLLYASLGVFVLAALVFGLTKILSSNAPPPPDANPAAKPPPGMILVRGGKFLMGTNEPGDDYYLEATPAHEVEVGDFFLDAREVTNAEYAQFIKTTGRQPPPHWLGREPDPSINQLPVTNISWDEANEYARTVGKRLPTEKEWEYAARGEQSRIYPWGNDWDAKCSNSKEDAAGGARPVAVGSYTACPSWCGALDMAGNVAEWVTDDFRLYPGSQAKAPNGVFKVYRGGAYNVAKEELKSFIRWYGQSYIKEPWLGFRCATDVSR